MFFTPSNQDESEDSRMNAELRAGVSDIARVKFLIGKTLEIREVEFEIAYKAEDPETRSNKCQEIWEGYPHFKDGRLVNKGSLTHWISFFYRVVSLVS